MTVERKKRGRFKALSGSVLVPVQAGRTTRRFTGRVAGKALAAGSYQLRLGAVDTAGNRSAAKTVAFKIVR